VHAVEIADGHRAAAEPIGEVIEVAEWDHAGNILRMSTGQFTTPQAGISERSFGRGCHRVPIIGRSWVIVKNCGYWSRTVDCVFWIAEFLVVRGVFSIVPPPFEFGKIVGGIFGDGAMGHGRRDGGRAVLGVETAERGFLGGSGYLRLPRELAAGRDRESSTWLRAINPVREDGEGARLRTLGKNAEADGAVEGMLAVGGTLARGYRWSWSPFARVGWLLRGADRSACRCVQGGLRRKMRVFL
jgi:hypothetical protein